MWHLYGFALMAGIASAVQPGLTASLSKGLSQPLVAGSMVSLIGGAALLLIGFVTGRLSVPSAEEIAAVPLWAWGGGLLGAVAILAQLFVAQQIGAAIFLSILVTAGVLTSILLDHFGWIGFTQHPASLWRILGGLLMVAGVALVAMF